MLRNLCRLLFFLLTSVFLVAQSRVVGGEAISDSSFENFNFVVGVGSLQNLRLAPNQKDIFVPFCTGTLISPTWVLTAGHCLANSDMFIYAKSNHLFNNFDFLKTSFIDNHKNAEISKVKQIFYPYDFQLLEVPSSVLSVKNDIALLELETPIIIDKYPKLSTKAILNDVLLNKKQAHLLGWGRLENGKKASSLMHTTLNVIDYRACSSLYKQTSINRNVDIQIDVDNLNDFDKNIICATKESGDRQARGACSGDSGTGLIYFKQNTPYVLGVLSNGSIDCGFVPDKYMNIAEYLDYVQDVLVNKGKNRPVRKDILRKGFIEDLPSGFHMLGVERNIDYKSDIFEGVKGIWIQDKDVLKKINIENGRLPRDVVLRAKSGFWIQK